ncbi:MAG: hypothetical protein EOP52_13880 [Sphingobacteriales bacterium]|nr:MAG: hypothetical protein EOP52_13880 [Sphingobacteriales bacterium]
MSKNSHPGYRSSKSGEFVTKQYAQKHPASTQKESIPNSGRGDTDRSSKQENKAPQKPQTDKKK